MVSLRRAARKHRDLCIAIAAAFWLAATPVAFAIDLPEELGGMPKDVPARPRTVAPYPGVHDLPAPRREPTMNDAAKLKLENDLNELRTRQKKFIDTGTKSRGDAAAARASAARDKARAAAQNKPPAADSR